jgi:hypothetical protein
MIGVPAATVVVVVDAVPGPLGRLFPRVVLGTPWPGRLTSGLVGGCGSSEVLVDLLGYGGFECAGRGLDVLAHFAEDVNQLLRVDPEVLRQR